jgi:hypothetical protein
MKSSEPNPKNPFGTGNLPALAAVCANHAQGVEDEALRQMKMPPERAALRRA